MNVEDLPRLYWWTALVSLAGSTAVAGVVWRRYRSAPAAVLTTSLAVIAATLVLTRLFPAFGLMRHPKTGRMVAVEQYAELHFILFGAATVAALIAPVALMRLPRSLKSRYPSSAE